MPPGVPANSWSADHADRRSNNDRTGRNYDRASVRIATTVSVAMFAASATFRGLGTDACKAQQAANADIERIFLLIYLVPFLGPIFEFGCLGPTTFPNNYILCIVIISE